MELLGSLEHVININLHITYMGCYNRAMGFICIALSKGWCKLNVT
jgi:hypothetical protein